MAENFHRFGKLTDFCVEDSVCDVTITCSFLFSRAAQIKVETLHFTSIFNNEQFISFWCTDKQAKSSFGIVTTYKFVFIFNFHSDESFQK